MKALTKKICLPVASSIRSNMDRLWMLKCEVRGSQWLDCGMADDRVAVGGAAATGTGQAVDNAHAVGAAPVVRHHRAAEDHVVGIYETAIVFHVVPGI